MTKPPVAVVGSLNADLTLRVDHLPGPGETVLSTEPGRVAFGGKGANQAAAAAAFGAQVMMIGRVGDDEYGRQIRADLTARGIDVSGVLVTADGRSGTAIIAVDGHGDNLIIVDPAANGQLRAADLPREVLAGASAVLVQLEIPLPTVAAAVGAARAPVVLNPAPAAPLEPALLDLVDVLVPNVSELGLLTGAPPPSSLTAIVALARKLAGAMDVVVTLGAEGALVVSRSGGAVTHIGAPRADVVDATGAGDCFCGTLAVSLAEGLRLTSAARVSVAAATISTTAPGARGKLPSLGEAQALASGLPVTTINPR
jgi:ribokinase